MHDSGPNGKDYPPISILAYYLFLPPLNMFYAFRMLSVAGCNFCYCSCCQLQLFYSCLLQLCIADAVSLLEVPRVSLVHSPKQRVNPISANQVQFRSLLLFFGGRRETNDSLPPPAAKFKSIPHLWSQLPRCLLMVLQLLLLLLWPKLLLLHIVVVKTVTAAVSTATEYLHFLPLEPVSLLSPAISKENSPQLDPAGSTLWKLFMKT